MARYHAAVRDLIGSRDRRWLAAAATAGVSLVVALGCDDSNDPSEPEILYGEVVPVGDGPRASALRNCSTCVISGTAPSCSNTAAAPARIISASDPSPSSPQARAMSTRVRAAS